MRTRALALMPLLPLLLGAAAQTQPAATAREAPFLPIAIETAKEPAPFRVEGKWTVAYEIHATNLSQKPFTIARVDVTAAGKSVASFQGEALSALLGRPGVDPNSPDRTTLTGGRRSILFLWLPFESREAVPAELRHRITFRIDLPNGTAVERWLEGFPVRVAHDSAPTLGPPLAGASWVARAISNDAYHRRGFMTIRGHASIPQRFAIDWGRLDDQGRDHVGEKPHNQDVAGYGSKVLAVADAVVTLAHDGTPDNDPSDPNSISPPNPVDFAFGNRIVLDLGGGRWAMYAHLKNGSLRVKDGERVKRGQVIAEVGNSGDATGPHLHFQLSDSAEPISGEGIPFQLEAFELLGRETEEDVKRGNWLPATGARPERRTNELPPGQAVIRFPEVREG
jgi:murein DD-endopeptidase MepM/ murein hydrolase activator NlpD